MKYEVFWRNPGYKIRQPLKKDIECGYLIVGGGVLGVSLAYFLNKQGAKNIVLIEKNTIASGATGKAAGFLTLKGELDLDSIVKKHGLKKGLVFWKGNHEGLNLMKEIAKKEKIDCDAEPLHTIYGMLPYKAHKFLFREYEIEKKIEKTTRWLSGEELRKQINTPLFKHAILSFDHGLSVNPLKYTQNLSKVIEKKGVGVYEHTPLINLEENKATTPHGIIKFKKIIIAVDVDMRNSKVKNRKSTIAITKPLTLSQRQSINMVEKKLVWDTKLRYHYLKLTKDNRILLGFGDRIVHKKHKGTNPHRPHVEKIRSFLKNLFPQLSVEIEYVWSGTFGVTEDYIPIIETKGNKISVGGASSQVVCTMAAKHIAHKLLNMRSNLDSFFNY
ncbi:FAD-binding oxidoreductase [Candidatus Pacearchaeota archaeon]|nr:FAD-binding oxidoreductase [Candidatus Pacearchaeota archaeon]